MAGSTHGTLLRVTTFGESHGAAMGCILDGCPAGLPITAEEIQIDLDRRRPGQNRLTTPRKEADAVEILSGVFEGRTLGTPIALLVRNKNADPSAYDALKDLYRPSHADFTWEAKFGLRDHRGGGRSSARETVGRVAAGAIARKLQEVRAERDTLGGTIGAVARGVPAGWGEPVFDRLEADLARAMLSIPAAKGFESGSGFGGTLLRGSEHNDPFALDADGGVVTTTNRSGGVQGGISNGMPITLRVAFKPVATHFQSQETVTTAPRKPTVFQAKGRHDPCVLPRAVPIVEAMMALVLADHWLRQRATSNAVVDAP
jgi:chorismate synthase